MPGAGSSHPPLHHAFREFGDGRVMVPQRQRRPAAQEARQNDAVLESLLVFNGPGLVKIAGSDVGLTAQKMRDRSRTQRLVQALRVIAPSCCLNSRGGSFTSTIRPAEKPLVPTHDAQAKNVRIQAYGK